jgi:hypothetical protein
VFVVTDSVLRSKTIDGETDDALQELLLRRGATDGLPVILPTVERVESMLVAAAFAGLDRDIVLGSIGPNMGEATVEKVAINAVMAGCLPEHLPIVIAAVSVLCDSRLDITEVQVTTHQLAPLIIVSGSAVQECGIASGFGALGYGHRANLTIGRALRLCLINLGGGWPGRSDMALLGQPGSVAYCIGESPEVSTFGPLHVSLGFAPDSSVVTVVCVGSPHSVLVHTNADDPGSADRLLAMLAHTIAGVGNNNMAFGGGTIVVILNPDHAGVLKAAGLSRSNIQRELWNRAGHSAGFLSKLYSVPDAEHTDQGIFRRASESPDSILLFVAGGPGLYSSVLLPWGGGPHHNTHISKEIVLFEACDVGGHS